MMKWATLLSIVVLGPGAAAIFVWFLVDLVKIFRAPPREDSTPEA